jgi:hypothetical protein
MKTKSLGTIMIALVAVLLVGCEQPSDSAASLDQAPVAPAVEAPSQPVGDLAGTYVAYTDELSGVEFFCEREPGKELIPGNLICDKTVPTPACDGITRFSEVTIADNVDGVYFDGTTFTLTESNYKFRVVNRMFENGLATVVVFGDNECIQFFVKQ